jgi:hypothetical protein
MARDTQRPRPNRPLKKNEYRCAGCGAIYEKGWSDEEAREEFYDDFPLLPIDEETSLICDHCYEAVNQDMRLNPWKYPHIPARLK